jgi:DNA-binding LytR/AlgR family response regulator
MICIAVDDEPLALDVLREYCNKVEFIELKSIFTSAIEAIDYINHNHVDLVFLDIQMPHISGLDFQKRLNYIPLIIFTTAYSEFALEGFNLDVLDYLLKPFSFERFYKAILKARKQYDLLQEKEIASLNEENRFLLVKVEYHTMKINIHEIIYIEGLKDYIKIYTGSKPILTKMTMKSMEEKLNDKNFVRIHKSFIVSLTKIKEIKKDKIIVADKQIPIGRQYKKQFFEIIDNSKI